MVIGNAGIGRVEERQIISIALRDVFLMILSKRY
jgi:hypothetical protein